MRQLKKVKTLLVSVINILCIGHTYVDGLG